MEFKSETFSTESAKRLTAPVRTINYYKHATEKFKYKAKQLIAESSHDVNNFPRKPEANFNPEALSTIQSISFDLRRVVIDVLRNLEVSLSIDMRNV